MKISINRLKQSISLHESPEEIAALLTRSGLEVEAVEEFVSVKGGLEGIVIGEVLTCDNHPDADKLKITTVDIGLGTPSQIVCGASNVSAGQKVVVATIGATLYPTSGEPFEIKKAKIRGQVSEGMICAEDEIGIGTSHAGIMVLDTNLPKEKQREKQIAAISAAILRMSRKKTGAIIVCAGKVKLEGLVSNGTNLDAEVNGLLIESIFQKESPLHDGALILSDGRIASAGCILPLTEKTDLPKSAGLRHRAAVGITERAEVAAFVVSEESGYISFAREGNLERKLDEEALQKLLRLYYS